MTSARRSRDPNVQESARLREIRCGKTYQRIDRFTSALVIPCLDHCHVPKSEMPHNLRVKSVSQADIDQLSVTVQVKSWEQICTVSQLRRRLKSYELLRKVLSSLWLAVIYVSVQRSGLETIMLQLQQAKELGVRGPKEMMSKYCRAGRAAWRVMSELNPGVLALVDLTAPVSNQTLEGFLFRTELCSEGILYRQQIHNVFVYLDEFLMEKQIALFHSFSPSLKDIRDEILRVSIHPERQVNESHRGLVKASVLQEFWADGAEQELVYFCDKNRNSQTSKLGSLWSVKSEDIGIPKSVAEALKQYHCNLLRLPSKNDVDLQSPADHYEFTCSIETGRTLDRILWRFLTTLYYDLVSELDATKHRFSATRDGGFAFVVAVICRSGKHDPDTNFLTGIFHSVL